MQSLPISIFPIHSKPFGYTYGEWSAMWWQWLLSIPKSKNPALDSTGANAHINQNYPNVFFLCQTYQEGYHPSLTAQLLYQQADQYLCQLSIGSL